MELMISKNISFMNENGTSNNFHKDESYQTNEETDYKNLINRLKDITKTITLLEKTIFR